MYGSRCATVWRNLAAATDRSIGSAFYELIQDQVMGNLKKKRIKKISKHKRRKRIKAMRHKTKK
jgi:hypothetical protein